MRPDGGLPPLFFGVDVFMGLRITLTSLENQAAPPGAPSIRARPDHSQPQEVTMATVNISRPPSMCTHATQMQTALGDLQHDFKLIQGLADFVKKSLRI